MAQERTTAQDIVAQALVREGHLREELVAAAREINATLGFYSPHTICFTRSTTILTSPSLKV